MAGDHVRARGRSADERAPHRARRPLLLAAALAFVAPGVGRPDPAGVDWERRVVRCAGLGAPSLAESTGNLAAARARTEREARRAAEEACLVALGTVLVRSGESARALLDGDAKLRASVAEMVARLARKAVPRYFADGGSGIDLELPLDGDLSVALLDAAQPAPSAVVGVPGEVGDPPEPAGILVDASALAVSPALAPQLIDPEGRTVYGASMLAPDARARGAVAYVRGRPASLDGLKGRLGDAPRVVRALRAQDADLVLSPEDARRLRGDPAFAAGRVVVELAAEAP